MDLIPYERCQEPACPFTRGWENVNHSVQSGCNRYGKFIQWPSQQSTKTYKFQRNACMKTTSIPNNSEPKKSARTKMSENKKSLLLGHHGLCSKNRFSDREIDPDYPDLPCLTEDSDFGSDTEDELAGTTERTSSQHYKSLKSNISEAKRVASEIQMSPLILNNIGISQNMVGPQLKVCN